MNKNTPLIIAAAVVVVLLVAALVSSQRSSPSSTVDSTNSATNESATQEPITPAPKPAFVPDEPATSDATLAPTPLSQIPRDADKKEADKDKVTVDVSAKATATTDNSKPESKTAAVTLKDYSFNPAQLTVKKGTTVTWTNQDIAQHTVTIDSGDGPKSDLFGQGKSFSYTFGSAGTFAYHCQPHPFMKGSVTVTE